MNSASRDQAPDPERRALHLVSAPAMSPGSLARVTVTPNEAAEMLGVSRDFFDEHVKPALRIIRPGRKIILIPVAELSRWAETSAARWCD
jgi:excisionase family DNA binding protein